MTKYRVTYRIKHMIRGCMLIMFTGLMGCGAQEGLDPSGDASVQSVPSTQSAKATYEAQCESCHGAQGEGFARFPALNNTAYTLDALAEQIDTTMPVGNVGACTGDCARQLSQYIINNFSDDTTLPVTIPSPATQLLARFHAQPLSIALTWTDNASDETGYYVQRKTQSGSWETLAAFGVDTTTYTDNNIQLGMRFLYRVIAFNDAGESFSEPSNSVTAVIPLTPPAAPSMLDIQRDADAITLTWQDNASNESHFVVERSTNGGSWESFSETTMTHQRDTQVRYDNHYRYRLWATNNAGDSSVVISDTIFVTFDTPASTFYANHCASCHGDDGQGTTFATALTNPDYTNAFLTQSITATMPLGNKDLCTGTCSVQLAGYIIEHFRERPTVPTAPSAVVAVPSGAHDLIGISWNDNSDSETGFTVYRKLNETDWQVIGETQSNTNQLNDHDVSDGNTYQYRITALNSIGESTGAESNVVELTAIETIPVAPSQLTSQLINYHVQLQWQDNADNENAFTVQRTTDNTHWETLSTTIIQSEYTDNSVNIGEHYAYRVTAHNRAGHSLFSNITDITLPQSLQNQQRFDTTCGACHHPSGTGGALFDGFRQLPWADQRYDTFLAKVASMPISQCDDGCLDQIATWIWEDRWGYEKDEPPVSSHNRGIRHIRLLTPYELKNTLYDLFQRTPEEDALPHEKFDDEFKYPTQSEKGILREDDILSLKSIAEDIALHLPLPLIGCNTDGCSDDQVAVFAQRVFRRPLTQDELNLHLAFRDTHGTRDMIVALLLSPHFLYRVELGDWNIEANAYHLNDYEVASALSYQLWGTAPDIPLLNLAASNGLSSSEAIREQAQIMLSDPRFPRHFVQFIQYYSKTYEPATEKPGLTQAVIDSMVQEQQLAITALFDTGTATLQKLFNPGYTFVDAQLAEHYGLNAPVGEAMEKIITSDRRGGLLHQGLTQIINSDFAATSLVKRGKMIRENMFCHTLGVPSGIDPDTITVPATPITTRERWDHITGPTASDGQCWQCHQLMNEPGSAFEQFDQNGQFRLTEQDYNGSNTALTLDPAGILRSNSGLDIIAYYSDSRELTQAMATSDTVKHCFVDSYYRYATGHAADPLVAADKTDAENRFGIDGNIPQLILDLLQSESFLYRLDRE